MDMLWHDDLGMNESSIFWVKMCKYTIGMMKLSIFFFILNKFDSLAYFTRSLLNHICLISCK